VSGSGSKHVAHGGSVLVPINDLLQDPGPPRRPSRTPQSNLNRKNIRLAHGFSQCKMARVCSYPEANLKVAI